MNKTTEIRASVINQFDDICLKDDNGDSAFFRVQSKTTNDDETVITFTFTDGSSLTVSNDTMLEVGVV